VDEPSLKVKNTYEGFLHLLDAIRRRSVGLPSEDVIFAVESRNLRIVDFLLAHGYVGYLLDPNRMQGYRMRYKASHVKDDDFDAFVLADILWRDRDQLVRIKPECESVERLKGLLTNRSNFVDDQISFTNRLSAGLREYYPAILEMFADPTGKTALAFIEAYPNFESTKAITRDELKDLLVKHHSYRKQRLMKMLAILTRPPIPVPPVIVEIHQHSTLHLIQLLRQVQTAIADYDAAIQATMQNIPEITSFKTLPAGGPIISSSLYVILGADRTRYKDANEVQSYLGIVPRTIQSGQSRQMTFRYACRQDYRVILTRWAFCTLRVCPWARKYYDKKRAEGKKHYHALRCLASILLKIAFTMWQEGTNYSEDRYLAQRSRHTMNNEQ
jgi:transposase